ncbi:MAG: hypothetical protein ACRD2W_20200 [Acidimicrobiales bacterium]
MASEHQRRELFTALETTLGAGPAQVMMELLPPFAWSDIARQSDLVALRGEIAELRGEVKGEIAELRGEVTGEIGGLRGEIGGLRGEIAELRADVHAQIPRYVMANVPLMFGVAGLVLAAVKLA